MSTAIVYYSNHHGNTKKLLDAIAAEDESILLSHTAQNSTLYAKGALRAAAFLSGSAARRLRYSR